MALLYLGSLYARLNKFVGDVVCLGKYEVSDPSRFKFPVDVRLGKVLRGYYQANGVPNCNNGGGVTTSDRSRRLRSSNASTSGMVVAEFQIDC